MAKMGLVPVYQKPRTTVPHPEHRKWPYLLRNLVIDRPDKVWCADITYIPMQRGFLYLVAIMERAIAAPSVRARWATALQWHPGEVFGDDTLLDPGQALGHRPAHRVLARRALAGLPFGGQVLLLLNFGDGLLTRPSPAGSDRWRPLATS